MDGNFKEVIITAITTIGIIATAYIAARWHVTPKNNSNSSSKPGRNSTDSSSHEVKS